MAYIYERCPYCENEVKIKYEITPQQCPNCGKWICPCTLCKNCNYPCELENKCQELNKE